MARAISSLPVPVSPVMSTAASEPAACATSLYTASIPRLRPTSPSAGAASTCPGSAGGAAGCARRLSARSTVSFTSTMSKGLLT